jgi:AcrR family transcriptional regulator
LFTSGREGVVASLPRNERKYNAPVRMAAAQRTQAAILAAAKRVFEERGWAGATVRLIAQEAAVSQKTVEALYGTKARLLAETVTYAIRGDVEPVEMLQRPHILEMESVPSAAEMLDLHAAHLRRINERSAAIAFVVEQAAPAEPDVPALWQRMNDNRRIGVRWAARTLLAKPGMGRVPAEEIESVFVIAFDWATYRVLAEVAGLSADEYEAWLASYYRQILLAGRFAGTLRRRPHIIRTRWRPSWASVSVCRCAAARGPHPSPPPPFRKRCGSVMGLATNRGPIPSREGVTWV